jgi:hypothetical protein
MNIDYSFCGLSYEVIHFFINEEDMSNAGFSYCNPEPGRTKALRTAQAGHVETLKSTFGLSL